MSTSAKQLICQCCVIQVAQWLADMQGVALSNRIATMFAPHNNAHKTTQAGSQVYRQVGLDTSVPMASTHQLVLMLFDGFQDSVARARGSLLAGRIDEKGADIGRAVRIVEEGLRSSLNLQAGGELAANLQELYSYITLRLTQANLKNDAAALEECTRLMEPLRSAWAAIGSKVDSSMQ